MQAVITAEGHQFTVKKGDKVRLNRISQDVGSEVKFDVLMTLGDAPKVGTPLVAGAKVTAKILRHMRDDKVITGKYRKRKGYHKKQGHRQDQTEVEIATVEA